jgi:hypothetical protein
MSRDLAERMEAAFTTAVNAPSRMGHGLAVPHFRDAEAIWDAIEPLLLAESTPAAPDEPCVSCGTPVARCQGPSGHPICCFGCDHGPAAPDEQGLAQWKREIIARLAIVNHFSGENDSCNGDEEAEWCDGCWRDSEAFIARDSTEAIADRARAALASQDKA